MMETVPVLYRTSGPAKGHVMTEAMAHLVPQEEEWLFTPFPISTTTTAH